MLGPPDDESVVRYSDGQAKIWKYGDIEVYFSEEGTVWMLHADAFHGRAPHGSNADPFDAGVIRHGAAQTLVEEDLSENGVHFEQVDYPALRGYASVIRTESGAELWFKEQEAEADFAGLYSFSLKAED